MSLSHPHLGEARSKDKHEQKSICLLSADATVYVGGLDEKVTESLLWELFLQAGPIGMKFLFFIPNSLFDCLIYPSCNAPYYDLYECPDMALA